jgi:hypothetical protein
MATAVIPSARGNSTDDPLRNGLNHLLVGLFFRYFNGDPEIGNSSASPFLFKCGGAQVQYVRLKDLGLIGIVSHDA